MSLAPWRYPLDSLGTRAWTLSSQSHKRNVASLDTMLDA